MRINGLSSSIPAIQNQNNVAETSSTSFGDQIKAAITKVNDLQNDGDQVATKLASGEPIEVHQAMLAMQKASMALQLTVQVRNKVIEAYQEVMKMQV